MASLAYNPANFAVLCLLAWGRFIYIILILEQFKINIMRDQLSALYRQAKLHSLLHLKGTVSNA